MGKIASVQVVYEIDGENGVEAKSISLTAMRKHCRPERVEDLLDDLAVLCSDVQEAREGARVR
jgi:hypothetical protein